MWPAAHHGPVLPNSTPAEQEGILGWAESRECLEGRKQNLGWVSEQRALIIPVQGDAIVCCAFLQCTLNSEKFHSETKHLSCTFSA